MSIKVIKGSGGYYAELQNRYQLDDPAAVDANKKCWLHVGSKDPHVVLPFINDRPIRFKDVNGVDLAAYFNTSNVIGRVERTTHPTTEVTVFEVPKESGFWAVVFGKHTH